MSWRRRSIATECGQTDRSRSWRFGLETVRSTVPRSTRWRGLTWACVAALGAFAGSRALAVDVDETPDIIKITTLRESALAYETGDGMPQDMPRAIALYCEAARYGDPKSQFDLGLMYAYGRGVERSDRMASFFLQAAAGQGVEQAQNMLKLMGAPTSSIPDCMRDPVAAKNNFVNPPKAIAKYDVPLLAPGSIVALVKQIAPQYSVPAPLVFAIMEAESNFNSVAISPRNAQGLMQLMPDTAARFRVKNAFDPAQNVRGGVAYLRWLLAYFEGDVALVAAAYNAGERAVERYRGVPPFLETRAYVRRIVAVVGPMADSFDPTVVEPSAYMPQIRNRQR